jgi:hypothetical protein
LEQGWSLSDCSLDGHKVANDKRDEIRGHYYGKLEIVAGKRSANWHRLGAGGIIIHVAENGKAIWGGD